MVEEKEKSPLDFLRIDLRNIQASNIKLFLLSIFFLFVGIYKPNIKLRNEMTKGLFIVIFIQILDYYTFGRKAHFLRHEKYLLSLSTLVGDGVYQIFIKPRIY